MEGRFTFCGPSRLVEQPGSGGKRRSVMPLNRSILDCFGAHFDRGFESLLRLSSTILLLRLKSRILRRRAQNRVRGLLEIDLGIAQSGRCHCRLSRLPIRDLD